MKIAWFTPLSNKSAIGRASASIARELSKLADLEVWHSEAGPKHTVDAKTTFFQNAEDPILSRLTEFDLVFYNFGNHLPFHREIFLTANLYPGVVILHDFVMHHFFAAYYLEELRDSERYEAEMERLYGAAGLSAARRRRLAAPIWETDAVVDFPMFEKVLKGALGIITHSDFLLVQVNRLRTSPARKIPLPYEIPESTIQAELEGIDVPPNRLVALTVGHVNPNKRVDVMLEVIGAESRLAARLHYLIAGPCDPNYRQRLDAIIQKHDLKDHVQFLGYVSDERLQALLTRADICVNLRYPAIEGASASVIEEMLYGRPVVVSDTGFYSELPSDSVWKVRPHRELEDLRAALVILLDEKTRVGLGRNAKIYAASTFRADQYAKEVVRFAWEVRSAKPLCNLADRLASEFQRMGVTAEIQLVDTVSAACASLFCSLPSTD